ncbi:zinc finger MYND domain-containing protein 12 isoform X2 [Trichomycterus rosablanca]|uniref:zinc finger MYND domain-containing protein 12 isoform X2 n=1 Tax=Trichomycterus rosablanca TaxID=2290929 RepID=UPI002F36019C
MWTAINPLANPKGENKWCEICQKTAYLQCTQCHVTFYCNVAHQQADWNSIHKKVCQLLIPIRTPAPFHFLQADRDCHRKQTQKRLEHLMNLSHTEAKGRVLGEKYEEALPAAQLSLCCAKELNGSDAVKLVPAYLLLAEANMGLGSLSEAESCLANAEWTVMRAPNCSRVILHQLHRTLGLLHTAKRNYSSALLHFANDVYYASQELGLKSVVTARGYFLMANVFMKQEKLDIARSLYSEVISTWHAHLSKLMECYCLKENQAEQCIDDVQCAEANQMLSALLENQPQKLNPHPAYSAMLSHSLAMICFLCNNHIRALEFGRKAAEFSKQCEQSNLSESIQHLIQQAETHLTSEQTPSISNN